MNSFIKNNKQLFSLVLGTLVSSCLHGITVNNQPLDSIIKPGEVLMLTFSENDNFVVWDIKNDNIDIKYGPFIDSSAKNMLKEGFQKYSYNPIRLKSSDILPNKNINTNSHIIGESINIKSIFSLTLKNCLFEAPYISITGNRIVFEDCFLINPQSLTFSINSLSSNYQTIQILFHDQANIPTVLSGSIAFDFKRNPIEILYLTNVKKIMIEFNPKIWNN